MAKSNDTIVCTESTNGVEMHWLPSVLYLTKVRNKDAADHHDDEVLSIEVDGKEKDIMKLFNYK